MYRYSKGDFQLSPQNTYDAPAEYESNDPIFFTFQDHLKFGIIKESCHV
jgi:hypothetical protein